jgi:hypothetical protein
LACLASFVACSHPGAKEAPSGSGGAGDNVGAGNGPGTGGNNAGTAGTGPGTGGDGVGVGGTGGTSAGSAGSGAAGTGSGSAGSGAGGTSAPATDMIDDLEDNDGRIIVTNGRQGPWHVFNDSSGGNQVPPFGGTFAPQSGGANNTAYAVHTTGSGYASYGGVGFDLDNATDQEESSQSQSYNAGAYAGITFWAKGTATLRVEFSQKAFVPTERGGSCPDNGCWNVYGTKELANKLTSNWQQFTILWSGNSNFVREDGTTSPAFDPSQIMDISFRSNSSSFDFWIDEVAFVRAGSSTGTGGRGGTTGSAGTNGAGGRGGTTGSAGTSGGSAGTSGGGGSSPPTACNLTNHSGSGSFTYYWFGQGTSHDGNGFRTACGYYGTESNMTDTVENIAMSSPANATYFAAIPGQNGFDSKSHCGGCVQITGQNGKQIVATIIDECPYGNDGNNSACANNPNGHLDLSYAAFNQLGYGVGNPSGTNWKFVPCPVTGNIIVRVKPGNPNELFIENTILAITGVQGASRQSYGAWHFGGNLSSGQQIQLTDEANRNLTVQLPNTNAGQNQDTGKQFPACQ